MPKKKPTKSTDLQPFGEGILEGIHYEPFEDSVYEFKGLIPGFINLIHPLCAELSSGPEVRVDNHLVLVNPEDKPIRAVIQMSFDTRFMSINLHSNKSVLPMKRDQNNWLAELEIPPRGSVKIKPIASCPGYPDVTGIITISRSFL